MKIFNFILALLTMSLFSQCKDDKDDNNPIVYNNLQSLTNMDKKAWEMISCIEDGIERISELESDTCFQPIYFVDDDNHTVYGINNYIYCIFNGSWGFYDNETKLGINIPYMGYEGIGPWYENLFNKWQIIKLSSDSLKLGLDFQGKNYQLLFKPI